MAKNNIDNFTPAMAEGIVAGWYEGFDNSTNLVEKALDYLEANAGDDVELKEMIAEARNDINDFKESIDGGVEASAYEDGVAEGIIAGWYAGLEENTELVENAINYLEGREIDDPEVKGMIEQAKEDLQEYKDKIDVDKNDTERNTNNDTIDNDSDNLENDNDAIENDYDDDDYDPID